MCTLMDCHIARVRAPPCGVVCNVFTVGFLSHEFVYSTYTHTVCLTTADHVAPSFPSAT